MTTEASAVPASRIEDLYRRYAPGGYRLALLLLGDRQSAEDCVQDAFVRAVGRLGYMRNTESFDAYLRRTIVNVAKNSWRRRSIERSRAAETAMANEDASSGEGMTVDRLVVWHAILRLPSRQRIAIVLRFYEDMAEDDIALIMHCRPGTARSLVSRGMTSLRSALEVSEDA